MKIGDRPRAGVERRSLAATPADGGTWRRLSAVYRAHGASDDALVAIRRVISIEGAKPRELREAGRICMECGEVDEAFRLLDAATSISEQPRDASGAITVIWRRPSLYRALESGFLQNVLLGNLGQPVRHVCIGAADAPPIVDRSILVVLGTELVDSRALAAARASGKETIGVVHMGDERGDRDKSFYADARFVLRHYESGLGRLPMREGAREQWIPNGYANGVGPRAPAAIVPATSRRHLCTFMGFPDQDPSRRELTDLLEADAVPCAYVPTPAFSAGFAPVEYGMRLEDAVFALVPRGNAPETIRFFDALERGCVPIVVDAPFLDAGGPMADAPVVRLARWSELRGFLDGIQSLKEDDRRRQVLQMQQEVMAWWAAEKLRWQGIVTAAVRRGFGLD